MSTLRPLGKNVIVRRADNATMSAGGIALIDNKRTNDAYVVFTGPEVSMVVSGDKVLLDPKGKVNKFYLDNEELFFVPEADIMAVYEDSPSNQ
jgi:co-chaperonin GroES (HSP10)